MMKLYGIWDLTENNAGGGGIITDKEEGEVRFDRSYC